MLHGHSEHCPEYAGSAGSPHKISATKIFKINLQEDWAAPNLHCNVAMSVSRVCVPSHAICFEGLLPPDSLSGNGGFGPQVTGDR